MLYTRKGDGGTTKAFDTPAGVRISKASCRTRALGTLDELNSLIGVCRVTVPADPFKASGRQLLFQDILNGVQKDLFVIQAEVAGAPKTITPEKVARMEQVIDSIEQELPPIKSFVIPGGSAASALLDFTRTVARRTEREVLEATLKGEATISEHTKSFLNRLSSLLYALARLANWKLGLREEAPDYQ